MTWVGRWVVAFAVLGVGCSGRVVQSDDETTGSGSDAASTTTPSTFGTMPATTLTTSAEADTGETTVSSDDATTGGDPLYCTQSCKLVADCCVGIPDCPGPYPFNVDCDAGVCHWGGCTSDDDCVGAGLDGYACALVHGYPSCVKPCMVDAECGAAVSACAGKSEDGIQYCEYPGCLSDEDCTGFGVCDHATGWCVCTSDDQCMSGFVCGGP